MTRPGTSYSLLITATVAYLQIDAVVSWDAPEFPRNRYKPWSELSWLTKSDAKYLLYTEDTWNEFMTSPLERMSYERVGQFLGLNNAQYMTQWERTNIALQNVAIDSNTWDCWINHYTGNDWVDLRDKHNVSWAFEALGWKESTWKSQDPEDWPETENKTFEELSAEEALAAERICCGPDLWNGRPLTEWEYTINGVSNTELRFRTKYSPTTASPSFRPSNRPTQSPTLSQAIVQEVEANFDITEAPTEYVRFTEAPSNSPTSTPTKSPSDAPSYRPSLRPSVSPSYQPSGSTFPSSAPTDSPTISAAPSTSPSNEPSYQPSGSMNPSSKPSNRPTISAAPSNRPSKEPSNHPSGSIYPSSTPTNSPTNSFAPSERPSGEPSGTPSFRPSLLPSDGPSLEPSFQPSYSPSSSPSNSPTITPSNVPSDVPTAMPCPANFTLVLFTDKYPKETTWNLAMVSNGKLVADSFGYKNDFETHEETLCIRFDTCYMFEIRDKWDDGICCGNGQGSYAGFIEYSDSLGEPLPIPGLNGGAFESIQRHKFCLDAAGKLVEENGLGSAIGVRFNGRHGET